jgi:hypothetical protein
MNKLEKAAREYADMPYDKKIEDFNTNARYTIEGIGKYNGFIIGAHWAIETIFNWLKDNMDTRRAVTKDMLGNDMCVEYLTADFKSVDELIGNFKYDKLIIEE